LGRVFHGKYALLDRQSGSLYAVLQMKFGEDFLEAGVRPIPFSSRENIVEAYYNALSGARPLCRL